MSDVKIIAFYLPQYHPIAENDAWWGKGFTEWTNVGKAKPLFKGHYQPKVPADLGYYDLRMPEIRESQATLAKEYGVFGFCYWHYWFGEGKRILEKPFNEVLNSGKPNFPFCLGWANESWKAKIWNATGIRNDKILIEQKYPGKQDNILHFYTLLNAFKDERYIHIDNKPLFIIYKPFTNKAITNFLKDWTLLAKENGFKGFYFVAHTSSFKYYNKLMKMGFDGITVNPISRLIEQKNTNNSSIKKAMNKLLKRFFRYTKFNVIEYKKAKKYFINKKQDSIENVFPTIIPNWDHSPRSGKHGTILHNSLPKYFEDHIKDALECVKNKNNQHKIIFLKSWNEWGEGNYVEPDLKYGRGYLEAIKRQLLFNQY